MARSDAEKNRQQIIAIATKAFAADPDASLNSIAKAAGIGPGTLYRHFPTRGALIIAVYQSEIQQVFDLAPVLLAKHPPLQALRLWLDRVGYQGRVKFGVADVLDAAMTPEVLAAAYGPMVKTIDQLLRAAEKDGAIRTGVDAEDFLIFISFLWRIPPGKKGEARARRLLDLVMAGLENGA